MEVLAMKSLSEDLGKDKHYFKIHRDELTERKKQIVDKAFAMMDRSRTGEITISDIISVYDVTKNKEYQLGKKSKEEILGEFLNNFEGLKGNNDGIVTY